MRAPAVASIVAAVMAACTGGLEVPAGVDGGSGASADAAPPVGDLDPEAAQARFVTTTDLMRQVIAPGCAAEQNECHSNEDFPDMSSEGNLWNLVNLRCNVGVGDRLTIEDFCERLGDELRITGGANDGFSARVGSIDLITNAQDEFTHFEITLDRPLDQAQQNAPFVLARDGAVVAALGGGSSLEADAGSRVVRVTAAGEIPSPAQIAQGDENRNQTFGISPGMLVTPGSARESYLVRRVFGVDTSRARMPLDSNADNPTEQNGYLTREETYVLTSWINCMEPGDGPYSPIRYDCAANAANDGTLP